MDFSQLINERGSIRDYKPDMVEPEKLKLLFEAVRVAPSAANKQPYKLYIISTKNRETELRKIYNSNWFVQPPYVLCMCTIEKLAWKRQVDGRSYAMVDAAIAFDHLVLSAANLGLGTCWIAAFDPEAARNFLELPEDQTPLLFSPLGYPDAFPAPKRRKALDDLVAYL